MHRVVLAAVALLLPSSAWALTSYDTPGSRTGTTTTSGVSLSGVVMLSVGCSGALLSTQGHILTAAHCLDGGLDATTISVYFLGGPTMLGSSISIEPTWTGLLLAGNDIAILTLAGLVSTSDAVGYDLYTNTDEEGQIVELAGYGYGGQGVQDPGSFPFGTRRTGDNRYDATGSDFGNVNDRIAVGDFDNGNSAQDAMANLDPFYANTDTDILAREVMLAPGDSGGPTFINGLIAGVHSFRAEISDPNVSGPDIDTTLNSSYGELFGDTRVSQHLDWIESQLVPEPSSFVFAALGLAAVAYRARRRRG